MARVGLDLDPEPNRVMAGKLARSRSVIGDTFMPSMNAPSSITRQLFNLPYWLPFSFHQSGV